MTVHIARVVQISAANVPLPSVRVLEDAVLPGVADIVDAVTELQ